MKLTNGYQGMVWEVPLGSNLGYGYVRSYDISEHFGWYLNILNHRRLVKVNKFDFDEFNSFDNLVAPILGINFPPQRGEGRWRPLGYIPISSDELIAPDMKAGHPEFTTPDLVSWGVIRGTASSDGLRDENGDSIRFSFDQVKHLGYYRHHNLRWITPRVVLEWMKILGMNYHAHQDTTVPETFLDEQKYYVSVSTPYAEVAKEYRNRLMV